ncbi:MAG: NADH-quinone oxidoreductase subunit J [Anaerolineales bacterium]
MISIHAVLIFAALLCALQAIRSVRLLTSALWLAGLSALLSILFYILGAERVAVIELSVGAGLVTVLFVFAINVAGDQELKGREIIPIPFAVGLVLIGIVLLIRFIVPLEPPLRTSRPESFVETLWGLRGLDTLVQIVLIFSGVLGLLGILAEAKAPLDGAATEEVAALRERDLQALAHQSTAATERISQTTPESL